MSVAELLKPWQTLNSALGLGSPVRDEAHYEALLKFVEECFDRFGSEDNHPVFGLVAIVADRLRDYENRIHPWPEGSTPASRLAFLMEQHQLRQADLPEVGSQSVVSAVLSGKRMLNLRQVKLLAARFGIPMEALAA